VCGPFDGSTQALSRSRLRRWANPCYLPQISCAELMGSAQ
jgi:hypothetical protein